MTLAAELMTLILKSSTFSSPLFRPFVDLVSAEKSGHVSEREY